MKLQVKSLLIWIVISISTICTQAVQAFDGAEVFDINKGEVIQTIVNSQSLQDQVKLWLSSASLIAGSFNIQPNDGIAIKIPLIPPYKTDNELINGTVTEVVMLISRSSTYYPTLLIFTKENHTLAVHVATQGLKNFLKKNQLFTPELNISDPDESGGDNQ
ncbi:hypothetical protein [Paenibacillus sp. N3.4]|uniref:hypothetical protein n=1 Tax=Paenibacillus sp. N3.4 TaxID=2603222 RepID=UPI0011CA344E|nr:hypothetical protein [Paenibacillus sp. N3.4]TXK71674.1 hypothetical protein FU659_32960 [Paenibacillus sp. N3.4]TXK71690.1 hypothetical protein FU659_32895 [Paenibacillus sp. N3.4]